ncbi:conserved membrane protein of unknown function [Sterolibacterium denitrificans]|uniref:YggT family protein n=1 Tax=Sterolibacterium denitrificans TaxID=157592 RepID=A0A7Z7HNP0_9PROT|nr:YggT family protein [Sterolibacterium denitrificans]SMB21192.1 conserved membrane protein of unknown function [Sterolibacterium denitrificans]
MLTQLLLQILDWVFGFFTVALLGRVLMQWARAPFRNPLGQFVIAVTDWAVIPARRLIPSAFGLDLASLALAWLAQAMYQGLLLGVVAGSSGALAATGLLGVILLALLALLRLGIYLIIGVVIIGALFSWINPSAPLAPLFNILSRPFLAPLRRFVPLLGGLDLSPLVLLLILQVMLTLLAGMQQALLPMIPWR